MTNIFAIKDLTSNKYLTKQDTLSYLTTTTRTFQTHKAATRALNDSGTLLFLCINEEAKRIKDRVAIDSKEFKNYMNKRKEELQLQVVHITLEELMKGK